MIQRHTHGDLVWVDVVSPTPEEVRSLMEEFSLDTLIADELMVPSVRSRVDTRDEYFYVVLYFPAFKDLHEIAGTPVELDIIVGKRWIITTRYGATNPLHRFVNRFEVDTVLENQTMREHAGLVFFHMLSEIYTSLHDELAYIGVRLDAAEDHIFAGKEKEMVEELSKISRHLLNYSQALDGHGVMLQSVVTPGVALFGYEYARHMRSVIGEYERLASVVQSNRAILTELRQTNDSLLTTKQNELMKTFTILVFVTFPLTLFTSLFSMNTSFNPVIGHPWDFWIIVGIMLSAAVAFFAYFKHKRWL
jgi:magnesium transporter